MPYNPTIWVDDQTPLSANNMNKIEQGIVAAADAAEAAQQSADAANQAISNHASAAAPHSGHAKTGAANTFSGKQTFTADVQLGAANTALIDVFGLIVPLNTHTRQVTAWDSAFPEKPKTVQIKDGSTVLATIDVTSRNSEGKVTQLKITQGARTRTWNITWTAGKEFPDSITVA